MTVVGQEASMAQFIAIYGVAMLVTSLAAAIIAGIKRRDFSYWATICFLFPPALILLFLMPKNTGPRPRRIGLDEEEERQLRADERDRLY
jgi:hypothetical protein